jgi:hypothetical protein
MDEYRVISCITFEVQRSGIPVAKEMFYPQYRNAFTTLRSDEYDSDGWVYTPAKVCYDNLQSAYEHLDRRKAIAEHGKKIYPYPQK